MTTTPVPEGHELVARLRARAASENEGGNEAAAERAMMGMEARSDIWAERVNLNGLIGDIVNVGRLSPSAPNDVREKFIKRQFELIDAMMRQSYLEGHLEGGLSRKEYDVQLDTSSANLIDTLKAERDEARRQWQNYEAAALDGLAKAAALQAEVGKLRGIINSLNINDAELLRVRNECELPVHKKVWARWLQMLIDHERELRAAVNTSPSKEQSHEPT